MPGFIIPAEHPFGDAPLVSATLKHRSVLYEKQEGRCYYCGIRITEADATIDHIVPLAKGGANGIANKVLSCQRCNCKKADHWPYQRYAEARALWVTQGAGWVRTDIEYRPFRVMALKMGDVELKQELNDMPVGTTIVKTKKGWSLSICNTHTSFERVAVRSITLEEGLLALKDAFLRHVATS